MDPTGLFRTLCRIAMDTDLTHPLFHFCSFSLFWGVPSFKICEKKQCWLPRPPPQGQINVGAIGAAAPGPYLLYRPRVGHIHCYRSSVTCKHRSLASMLASPGSTLRTSPHSVKAGQGGTVGDAWMCLWASETASHVELGMHGCTLPPLGACQGTALKALQNPQHQAHDALNPALVLLHRRFHLHRP